MKVTIYEDENGVPRLSVESDTVDVAEKTAEVYKAIRKELDKKEEN